MAEYETNDLPADLRDALTHGAAVFPSELTSEQFANYLEARDERIVKEKVVKVGANGSTKFLLVGVETSADERKEMNFPRFKMKKRLRDYLPRIGQTG